MFCLSVNLVPQKNGQDFIPSKLHSTVKKIFKLHVAVRREAVHR